LPSDSKKELGDVYQDRNLLACAVAQLAGIAGWKPDPESPDDWAIVWVETPVDQVSWHVPREMAEDLAPPQRDSEYDGYDREEKNERLAEWCERGCDY